MEHRLDHILYVGSVRVVSFQSTDRLDIIKQHMDMFKEFCRAKPVLLLISISGIKVCSPDGTVVHMAHALKRISYATCDLRNNQFCFLAREPTGHYSNQFCHIFATKSAKQAEEVNSIVGNAFRMAYTSQLKTTNLNSCNDNRELLNDNETVKTLSIKSTSDSNKSWSSKCEKPTTLPGLVCSHDSTDSTPTSDENNSPIEMNLYKRLIEKPPLIKRSSVNIREVFHEFPVRPPPEGCISYMEKASSPTQSRSKHSEMYIRNSSRYATSLSQTSKMKSSSDTSSSSSDGELTSGSKSQWDRHLCTKNTQSKHLAPLPPPPPPLPPERADSLVKHKEENELRMAPWFQAGIPREITLEVLSQEPIGSFMVRESTTKSGCYALSVRVPKEHNPRGIAHYLIIKTNKGYKIKGFTKEFTTLTALITHHSVMQELLPCPLSLSRYNPTFSKTDSNKDFEDIDSDTDYNTLADFRKMMAELNV